MLFLAVTAGFLVENQREHYIEHIREKQFIQSLINDVKADTGRLTVIINARQLREKMLDSLSTLLNAGDIASKTGLIYFLSITPARSLAFRFVPNDGTMQQLKNSGALRLIRTRKVVDSIAKYDVSVRNLLHQGAIEEEIIQDYREASSHIFNSLIYEGMLDSNNAVIGFPKGNPPLLVYTTRDLGEWNYRMSSMKNMNKANRRDSRLLLKQAANLLKTLKEEYGLE